jgi:hypothetical protein
VVERYADDLRDLWLGLDYFAVDWRVLEEMATLALYKDVFSQTQETGLVFVGFGAEDPYPGYVEIKTEGLIAGRLKWKTADEQTADPANGGGVIRAFAQSDMAEQFVLGIDSSLKVSILDKLAEGLFRAEGGGHKVKLPSAQVNSVIEKCKKAIDEASEESYKRPLLDAVGTLPRDELAAMAEALVSLTSFKRRITEPRQTVGGPVDVAVVTKADGLVWIKRKQYFNHELNPHYGMNYFARMTQRREVSGSA